jgi:hypothetical protein
MKNLATDNPSLIEKLFEKLITLIENVQDGQVIKKVDFSKGRNFTDVANESGI